MICPACGAQHSAQTAFCSACGAPLVSGEATVAAQAPVYQQPVIQQPVYQQPVAQPIQPVYQQPVQQPVYQQPVYQQPVQQVPYAANPAPVKTGTTLADAQHPMKWHKFLVYFMLWANVVLYALVGIMMMTGAHYQGEADLVYNYFEGLQTVDIIMGIAYFAAAAFMGYTAFNMLKLKKNAPNLLYATYAIGIVFEIVYPIIAASITGVDGISIGWGGIAGSALGIVLNKIYYGKRSYLFVN